MTTHLKTRQSSIVLRQFAFPTLECLDFHTENTSTITQHMFEKKYNNILLQSDVSFELQDFIQSGGNQTTANKGFGFSMFPTLNFCCVKYRNH